MHACAPARRPCDAPRAKYALRHTVRTHMAADDNAFTCMGAGEDAQGLPGVFLRKSVIEIASKGLAENLRRLRPLITPRSIKARAPAAAAAAAPRLRMQPLPLPPLNHTVQACMQCSVCQWVPLWSQAVAFG